jgi:predicted dehydrogenase
MAFVANFENGAIGHFSTTPMLNGFADVGLDLYARDTVYKIGANTLSVQKTADGETQIFTGKNSATMDEDKAFVQAVKSGKRTGIKSTYADALKTLRVTLAANQSAKSGKVVKL